ncbi:chorismate lyase [Methylophilaceae bacterium]|jgi:chorismate lyase|nr:chorismate lyase [Methylophilaceae bacterium]|tara:strand:+ start:2036 stop:2560 length:525 start_codon:yes stop_codon:yes gene_type:complete
MWNKNIQIDSKLKFWLLDVKSLSYRIRNIAKLEIIPVKKNVSNIFHNEKKVFGDIKSEHLYLREVLIYADKLPIMYARTVLPSKYLRGFWHKIKKLNNKPLADIVFEKKMIIRSDFKFKKPSNNDSFSRKIKIFNLKNTKILATRQSTFRYKNEKALLTEVFFNNFEKFDYLDG